MNFLVKYEEYEIELQDVQTYRDLLKHICQGFKFILKNNFVLYYFDEDKDKITIANQEDFEAITFLETYLEIYVITNDEDLNITDDSFQKLNKSVKESVNQFRKFSNSIKEQEKKEISTSPEKITEQNTVKELKDEILLSELQLKRDQIIKEINSTIDTIKKQILIVQSNDKEKILKQKLQKLQKPELFTKSLQEEINQLTLFEQINNVEQNLLNSSKQERSDLKMNYNYLEKQIHNIFNQRIKQQQQLNVLIKEYNKQVQKIELAIIKNKKFQEKQLKQLQSLLEQNQQKLKEVQNQNNSLGCIEYMNKKQLEIILDKLTKQEMKVKKEKKSKNEKLIQKIDDQLQISDYSDILNESSEFQID